MFDTLILAGGLGTRLKSVVKDVPKPMAMVNGKPFLEYVLDFLLSQGVTNVVICVGYKKETIIDYFKNTYKTMSIEYSIEDAPLGTGGAIKEALSKLTTKHKKILLLNGDTFFKFDLAELSMKSLYSDIALSIKEMNNVDRYGSVIIENGTVVAFKEKSYYEKAYINCGVYMFDKKIFDDFEELVSFSFEKFLEDNISKFKIESYISNKSYFIDIGIPSDYEKSKEDFRKLF